VKRADQAWIRGLAVLICLLAPVFPASAQEPSTPPPGITAKAVEAPTTESAGPDLSEANRLVREQDYSGAEALLSEMQADFPDDTSLLLMRGELLLALGRTADAVPALQRVAELAPDRERTHFQLGTALAALGQTEQALTAFARELELSEDDQVKAMAHLNRSMLLQQEKRITDAAAEIESVITIQPENTQAFGDLSTLYLQAGRFREATDALERGEQAGYASGSHYYSIGARLYKEERLTEAHRLLSRAVELSPEMAHAERSLAACLEKMGRSTEALSHLERYLELAPDAADADQVRERIAQLVSN